MIDTPTDGTLYPINDSDGNIAAFVTVLDEPFHTLNQWQTFLNQSLPAMVASANYDNIEGLYAVSYWHEHGAASTLQFTRMSHGDVAEAASEAIAEGFPDNTLGLLALIHETDDNLTTAVLALQAGMTVGLDQLHSDHIITATSPTNPEQRHTPHSTTDENPLRMFGHLMLRALDSALAHRLTISR
jgi:hypothetical protein